MWRLRPRRIKRRLLCRRNKWLILEKLNIIVHFLFFWSVGCPKVKLVYEEKHCLKMGYIKSLLTMTVKEKIQSNIFKTIESANQFKWQIYAFSALLAFKKALRGRKCFNQLSQLIAQIKYINWHLDGTIAPPSFRERKTFRGAIRPLISFYNIVPLGLHVNKPPK